MKRATLLRMMPGLAVILAIAVVTLLIGAVFSIAYIKILKPEVD